jgi:hypothetical protein
MLLLPAILFTAACGRIPLRNGEEPIARVYDKYLYPGDLSGIFSGVNDPADSARMARSFIDQWVKRQLLVRMAEYNVPPNQQEFEARIAEYRASLLVYEYEKQLVREKVDTTVTNRQLEDYYEKNSEAFTLEAPIVKALYIRMEKGNSNLPEVRRLMRSTRDQDFENLINLGQAQADKFDFFNDEWVSFPLILEKLPGQPEDFDEFLKRNKTWESEDNDYAHLLLIRDYLVSGEQAPLSYIEDKIKGLVLSKRKLDYIKQIEQELIQDAMSSQQIEIYN